MDHREDCPANMLPADITFQIADLAYMRFIVPSAWDGLSIKFLLREKLHFSMHQISRIKYRASRFHVNGRSVWVNTILHTGDELRFPLDDPSSYSIRHNDAGEDHANALPILFEDDFILAAAKPAGMVSHPSHGHHGDSALDLLSRSFGRLYLIGRLDKDTSGVLLFAKHEETASLLSRQKESGSLFKTYTALVHGRVVPENGTISLPIGIEVSNPLKMKTDPAGKTAVTHYRTIRTMDKEPAISQAETGSINEPVTLLSVTIEHGRTHQIRVHLSRIGHPLVGDRLYGTASETMPYALLHASALQFIHPYSGKPVSVRTPEPAWRCGIGDSSCEKRIDNMIT